ncbi:Hemimethylated DNA-binding protein YccV like-domain-containing protein [Mycena floridula]|nr:Hemimethylated DNA-binding protein YccV like-domain-containing protein [Mycena floridula]
MALPVLPLDILIHILHQLPSSRKSSSSSALVLANFAQVNSLFHDATLVMSVWEQHYRIRYRHCNEAAEAQRRELNSGSWRLMYAARRRLDKTASQLLERMVHSRRTRFQDAKTLWDYGFDIWDFLELESEQPVPAVFRQQASVESEVVIEEEVVHPMSLTRIYWAKATMRAISRGHALEIWCRALSDPTAPFVLSYSALSCFFGVPLLQISSILSDLTDGCRQYLIKLKCPFPLTHTNYDISKLSAIICEFMDSQGFGPCESRNFHDIHNHFPHLYLTTHKHSIPISLVHIFCSIANGLDIAASPVSFPSTVIAHVSSPKPDVEDIYVDVFGSQTKTVLSLRHDIPQMLAVHNISPQAMLTWIRPSNAAQMLLRSARNMMTSLHTSALPSDLTRTTTFLTLSLHLLLDRRPGHGLAEALVNHAQPLDCATCLPTSLSPALTDDTLSLLCAKVIEDQIQLASNINLRSVQDPPIQYFVGMIFRHRLHNYLGCIMSWDANCRATESWIETMSVDKLPRGRNQPFYSVFALDGTQRYVAEDNIERATDLFLRENIMLPMYFRGVQTSETADGLQGRFLPSPDLQNEFPEDDHVGDAWLNRII